MSYFIISAFVIIVGYLFGSICSAVIISRAFNLPDPRSEGSKNPGATNVLRLSGKNYAAMVLVFDVLKGTLPVIFAKLMPVSELVTTYTCLAAVLGHMFPAFFSFRGGKGVATAIGGLLGLQFILGVWVIAIWILVAHITKYASLASLLSMTAMPLLALWTTRQPVLFTPLFFITLFIFYKHYENITRLLDGEESKISFTKRFFSRQEEKLSQEPDEQKPDEQKPDEQKPDEQVSAKAETKTSSKAPKKGTKKSSKKSDEIENPPKKKQTTSSKEKTKDAKADKK